jgi:RNA polymerase sigma factor (sigma-70 family)
MGRTTWSSVFRQVCSGPSVERYLRMEDAELLGAFVTGLDEAAFEALLRRHGPMVFGVAHRVLKNEADSEDVFQATFLLLARKAGSIRKRQSLASWLHGVAHRLAVHERSCRARNRVAQTRIAEARLASQPAPTAWSELRDVLDDVLARLPEKYRIPLVYCYLEGWTQEEIAQRMGRPIGTVRSWLARGRELLRKLLTARGISLTAVPFSTILLACAATARCSVPVRLIRSTSQAARLLAGGAVATHAVSGNVLHLMREGMMIMALAKLKIASVCLLACVVVAAGAGWAAFQGVTANPRIPTANAESAVKATAVGKHQTGLDADGEPLPASALVRMGSVRFRHERWLEGLAVAPGGQRIAGVGGNGLTIWDAATGRPLRRWTFSQQNWCRAFAPDGKSLVVGSDDAIVRLLDAETGKELRRFVGHTTDGDPFGPGVLGVSFAGAGRRIVSWAIDKTVRVWDTDSGRELRRLGDKDWIVRGISPDGRVAAIGKDEETKALHLWDLGQGKEFHQLAHEAEVRTVAFSPDNKLLAAAVGKDGQPNKIVVWEIQTGRHQWTLAGHDAAIYALAFAPDGRTLASGGGDQTLRLWALDSGKELHKTHQLGSSIHQVAFRQDAQTLVVGLDQSVRLWNVAHWKERRVCDGPTLTAESLAWSPNGKVVASTHGNQLWLWDSSTGKVLSQVETGINLLSILAFSADGRSLFTAGRDRTLHVWDAATGKVLRSVGREGRQAERMALSPDAKTVAAWGAGTASTISLRDVGTGKELRQLEIPVPTPPVKPTLHSVLFSSDGRTLYAGGSPNLAVLRWDVASGKLLPGIGKHDGGLNGVALSPDQRSMAVVTMDGSLYVWELASGRARLITKDAKYATAVVFSPDGRLLALTNDGSHCHDDGKGVLTWEIDGRDQVRLMRVADGKIVRRLAGHGGGITSVAFSPDSTRLASAGDDTTMVVWDVRSAGAFGPGETVLLQPEELPKLWMGVGGDAAEAYRHMGHLIAAGDQAVGLIRGKLAPVYTADPDRVAALVKKLDSSTFSEREEAARELKKLGDAAEPGLRRALQENLSLESRRRIEKLIDDLFGQEDISGERLRTLRAIEILERIGSTQACQVLGRLAEGSADAWLTKEAKATLQRLAPTRNSP